MDGNRDRPASADNGLSRRGPVLNQWIALGFRFCVILGTASTAFAIDSTLQSEAKISESADGPIAVVERSPWIKRTGSNSWN